MLLVVWGCRFAGDGSVLGVCLCTYTRVFVSQVVSCGYIHSTVFTYMTLSLLTHTRTHTHAHTQGTLLTYVWHAWSHPPLSHTHMIATSHTRHPPYINDTYHLLTSHTHTWHARFTHLRDTPASHTYVTRPLHTHTWHARFTNIHDTPASHTCVTRPLHTPTWHPRFTHIHDTPASHTYMTRTLHTPTWHARFTHLTPTHLTRVPETIGKWYPIYVDTRCTLFFTSSDRTIIWYTLTNQYNQLVAQSVSSYHVYHRFNHNIRCAKVRCGTRATRGPSTYSTSRRSVRVWCS